MKSHQTAFILSILFIAVSGLVIRISSDLTAHGIFCVAESSNLVIVLDSV